MSHSLAHQRTSPSISLSSYARLRNQIQQIFLSGQKKIDQAKVEAYWKAGKTINALVGRAKTPYLPKGQHVVAGLAEDLKISPTVLYRSMELAAKFPHFATSQNVDWSHYAELLPMEDNALRSRLLEQASKEAWSVKKLRGEISKGKTKSSSRPSLLKPRLGKLNTYRVVGEDEFGFKPAGKFLIDLGFRFYNIHQTSSGGDRLTASSGMVEIKNHELVKSSRIDQDRYFYQARAEKGIDGDTFWVVIDLGFGQTTEQKLRLRGIDAKELGTYGAKKAAQFIQALLPSASEMLIKTSKSPSYDRFLADVYVPVTEKRQRAAEKYQPRKIKEEDLNSAVLSIQEFPGQSSAYAGETPASGRGGMRRTDFGGIPPTSKVPQVMPGGAPFYFLNQLLLILRLAKRVVD